MLRYEYLYVPGLHLPGTDNFVVVIFGGRSSGRVPVRVGRCLVAGNPGYVGGVKKTAIERNGRYYLRNA